MKPVKLYHVYVIADAGMEGFLEGHSLGRHLHTALSLEVHITTKLNVKAQLLLAFYSM